MRRCIRTVCFGSTTMEQHGCSRRRPLQGGATAEAPCVLLDDFQVVDDALAIDLGVEHQHLHAR